MPAAMPDTLPESKGSQCWLLVYTDNDFKGSCVRLYGPARYPNLRIEGRDLHDEIDSCRVGPQAYVRCFDDECFENTVLWLLPDQQVPSLAVYGFGDRIDSIEIFAQPPRENEHGYAEYLQAIEHRKQQIQTSQ